MLKIFFKILRRSSGIHILHGRFFPFSSNDCIRKPQVLYNDVDNVAKQVILGVEAALKEKKNEYINDQNLNLQKFAIEVNLVTQ